MVNHEPVSGRRPGLIAEAGVELTDRAVHGELLHEVWWLAAARARHAFGGAVGAIAGRRHGTTDVHLEGLAARDAGAGLGQQVWDAVHVACHDAWGGLGWVTTLVEADPADVSSTSGANTSERSGCHPVAVAAVPVDGRRHVALVVVRSAGTAAFDFGDARRLVRLAAAVGVASDVSRARQGWGRPERALDAPSAPGRACRRPSRLAGGQPHGRGGRTHR